jgi:hypothetical protein
MSTTETVVLEELEEIKLEKDEETKPTKHSFFSSHKKKTRAGNPWPTPPDGSQILEENDDENQVDGRSHKCCVIS